MKNISSLEELYEELEKLMKAILYQHFLYRAKGDSHWFMKITKKRFKKKLTRIPN